MKKPVHILRYGFTLCGLEGTALPPGHKWVTFEQQDLATCPRCKQGAKTK